MNANFYYFVVISSLISFQYDQKTINNKTLFSYDKHTSYVHSHSREKEGERRKEKKNDDYDQYKMTKKKDE